MTTSSQDPNCGYVVRRAMVSEAVISLDILREASLWSARFGEPIWPYDAFSLSEEALLAKNGELIGGFDLGRMDACMRLQIRDEVFWPDDDPGEALYVHKVAVRRSAAGQGWASRLIDYAVGCATASGAKAVRLDTRPRHRMLKLYADLGFEQVDMEPRRFDGRWLVRMQRYLPRRRGQI